MVAGVVVDVDGDGAELGDFLGEGCEGVVVLAGGRVSLGGEVFGGDVSVFTVRVRRLRTW